MTTPHSLTEEDLRLLESLPQWNGPSVTGAKATPEIDRLNALGFIMGQYSDAPFDGDEVSLAWRNFAADTLLATLQAERERFVEQLRDIQKAAQAEVAADPFSPDNVDDIAAAYSNGVSRLISDLSPDVLGDGQTGTDSGLEGVPTAAPSVTAEVEIEGPSAADGGPQA